MGSITDKVQREVDTRLSDIAFMIKIGDVEGMFRLNSQFKERNNFIHCYLGRPRMGYNKAEMYFFYQRAVHHACMELVTDRMEQAGLYRRGKK